MGTIQVEKQTESKIEPTNQESEDPSITIEPVVRPDPEVLEKPKKRTFSAAYKLKILEAAGNCTSAEERGALLRREGLYHSYLHTWKQQREAGQMAALTPRKRGRKATPVDPLSAKVERLERENERLRKELDKAGAIIEAQKKISSLMEILQEETGSGGRRS